MCPLYRLTDVVSNVFRLDSIAGDAELMEKSSADLKRLAEMLQTQCEQAIAEYEEKLKEEPNNAEGMTGLHSSRSHVDIHAVYTHTHTHTHTHIHVSRAICSLYSSFSSLSYVIDLLCYFRFY